MTALATVLVVATLAVAAADWWAVARDRRPVEYVLKPLTMVALIGAALALDPVSDTARLFMVAGLVCSLAGDVFLMLHERFFLGGLVSFLLGHVMYVVALLQLGIEPPMLFVGVVLVLVASALVGSRVVRGSADTDQRLPVPVAVYMAVISLMVVSAFGTLIPLAIAGALLFYVSDAVLGWNRFVSPIPNGRLIIMTTYHLGQVGLVLALLG
jgi:uncharacterized membrane protein YhhN